MLKHTLVLFLNARLLLGHELPVVAELGHKVLLVLRLQLPLVVEPLLLLLIVVCVEKQCEDAEESKGNGGGNKRKRRPYH